MTQEAKLDRHILCEARGIDPSRPDYERLSMYASVGEWLIPQFERNTRLEVTVLGCNLMADFNLLGAIFDDQTDTGAKSLIGKRLIALSCWSLKTG